MLRERRIDTLRTGPPQSPRPSLAVEGVVEARRALGINEQVLAEPVELLGGMAGVELNQLRQRPGNIGAGSVPSPEVGFDADLELGQHDGHFISALA